MKDIISEYQKRNARYVNRPMYTMNATDKYKKWFPWNGYRIGNRNKIVVKMCYSENILLQVKETRKINNFIDKYLNRSHLKDEPLVEKYFTLKVNVLLFDYKFSMLERLIFLKLSTIKSLNHDYRNANLVVILQSLPEKTWIIKSILNITDRNNCSNILCLTRSLIFIALKPLSQRTHLLQFISI